jgi:hypothetical protein
MFQIKLSVGLLRNLYLKPDINSILSGELYLCQR